MAKYLIWDFDGTLGYRVGMWTGTIIEILQKDNPNRKFSREQIQSFLQTGFPWHNPAQPHPEITNRDDWWNELNPIFERIFVQGIGFNLWKAQRLAHQVRTVYPDPSHWRVYEDTISTLETLSDRGWKHVILSNHVPELKEILAALSLEHYFESIFNSAKTGYEKPHIQAFQTVLSAVNNYTAMWMIGDSIKADIKGAENVGISAILVRKRHPDAKIYCENLTQILNVV